MKKGSKRVTATVSKEREKIRIANTPYLVILESPSKCKKIEKYLGFQYKCIASNGHIRGLTKIRRNRNKTSVAVEYTPIFDILPEKAAHVEYMRSIITYFLPTPENIFIATDDDREGEAIGWHICQTFGLPLDKVRRMIFHEITEKVIQDAARNTIRVRMEIVLAQQARQMLDQMVGFEISPLLTRRLSASHKDPLSAGRCQTPALRFVYDKMTSNTANSQEIEYRVVGSFFSQATSASSFPFPLTATLTESLQEKTVETFLTLSKTFAHEMTLGKPTIRSTAPPAPFNTSRLLQYTSNRWNMSPKKTMEYCQLLYQHGYITYMRTESSKYSDVFIDQVGKYLSTLSIGLREDYTTLLHEPGINPHEAIRVTDIRVPILDTLFLDDAYSVIDKKRIMDVYDAIWKRSIQSCMKPYEYKHVDIFFSAPQEKRYHRSLEIPIAEGFTRFSCIPESGELEIDNSLTVSEKKKVQTLQEKQIQMNGLYLFLQSAKSPIKCMQIEAIFQLQDKKKSRYYTESSLIQTLEEHGIGRPSTYALLVDTIQERGYVKKQDIDGILINGYHYILANSGEISRTSQEKRFGQEKNKLVLQELGKIVMETLLPTFDPIFSYHFTKEMESKLDAISSVSSSLENPFEICKEMETTLKIHTEKWKKEMQEKYEIDDKYELFFSRKGAFIREKKTGSDKKGDTNLSSDEEEEEEAEERIKGLRRVRNIKLDMEKLKKKEYTLEELLEIPREFLGHYQEKEIRLKTGKFGAYILWGEETLKCTIKKEIWSITLEDIIVFLQEKQKGLEMKSVEMTKSPENKDILRILSDTIEIRSGRFGAYIYHRVTNTSSKKTKPFYNLKLFPGDWRICEKTELLEWIEKTYGIH